MPAYGVSLRARNDAHPQVPHPHPRTPPPRIPPTKVTPQNTHVVCLGRHHQMGTDRHIMLRPSKGYPVWRMDGDVKFDYDTYTVCHNGKVGGGT